MGQQLNDKVPKLEPNACGRVKDGKEIGKVELERNEIVPKLLHSVLVRDAQRRIGRTPETVNTRVSEANEAY